MPATTFDCVTRLQLEAIQSLKDGTTRHTHDIDRKIDASLTACTTVDVKVIGSSDEVHVVDALAITGDEGRDSLR